MIGWIKAYGSVGIMLITMPYILMKLIVERQCTDPGYPRKLHPDLDWEKTNETLVALLTEKEHGDN